MRNRILVLFLFPVFVLLWMIGWSLHVAGDRKQSAASRQAGRDEEETIEIEVAVPLEQETPQ